MDPPRLLAHRYRLEAPIGRGGVGVVHRAHDQQLDRAVAVKLLSEIHDEVAFVRFLTEAKRTAAVRHPNIIEVFDVGRDGPDAFLVMELLEGETLADRLVRGPMTAAEAVAVASQVCDALAAAHDAGLVHRDVKPANVFLVQAEGGLRVKLLDFGIAKHIDAATAHTDPGMIVGTLAYLSPEQIRGVPIDGRADLYALGMALYRMLTAGLPFEADNVASAIHHHLSVVPPSLRERAPERAIPRALDAAVLKLLAKEPSARPGSAREAKRDLLASLGDASELAPTLPDTPFAPRLGTERVVDLVDDGAPDLDLDLDLGSRGHPGASTARPRGPAIAPVPPLVRLPPAPPFAVATPPAPLPGWLAPLERVPENVSKRVAGYALFALFVYVVFFSGSLAPSVGLALLAALGGASFWASRRAAG